MERTYRLPSETASVPLGAGVLLSVLVVAISVALVLRVVLGVACGA